MRSFALYIHVVISTIDGVCKSFWPFLLVGLDYVDPKTKSNYVGKILLAAALTALCILMLKQSPSFNNRSPVTP